MLMRVPVGFLTLPIPMFQCYPRFNKQKEHLTFSKDVQPSSSEKNLAYFLRFETYNRVVNEEKKMTWLNSLGNHFSTLSFVIQVTRQ